MTSADRPFAQAFLFGYAEPAELTVSEGDSVTWVNDDRYAHSIDFGGYGSDALKPGESFTMEFGATGDYDYVCGVHGFTNETGIVHARATG